MINLYNGHITDILPPALAKDPKTKALSYAINKAIQRMIDYSRNISVYTTIDTLPEQILDLLALELNTQYYDDSLSIYVKRNLIKNTLKWYKSTGTLAAVEEAVTAVFGNGTVEEWFEYGGEPYHFRINTSSMNTTDEMIQQITDIVSSVQNVRSYLEEVVVEVIQQTLIHFGSVVEVVMDSTTLGIDMNIDTSAYVSEYILLSDISTGVFYAVSVADGKLIMQEISIQTEDAKQALYLQDVKTNELYAVTVQGGKMFMEQVEEAEGDTKESVLLIDTNTGEVYSLNVFESKLNLN